MVLGAAHPSSSPLIEFCLGTAFPPYSSGIHSVSIGYAPQLNTHGMNLLRIETGNGVWSDSDAEENQLCGKRRDSFFFLCPLFLNQAWCLGKGKEMKWYRGWGFSFFSFLARGLGGRGFWRKCD